MIIGIGSGSTVVYAVERIGKFLIKSNKSRENFSNAFIICFQRKEHCLKP